MKTLIHFFFISLIFNLSHLCGYELGIVSMFRNEASYFKEWIDYHKMVGVEHFWLYNDGSVDHFEDVLAPYIKEGIVEVFNVDSKESDWIIRQLLSFREGIKKAKGVSRWVALIDLDEFLVPAEDKTVTDCLNKHFFEATAVYVNWRNFGTGHTVLKEGESTLSHLVSCSMKNHPRNSVGKSIVKPDLVNIDNIVSAHFYLPDEGSFYLNGDGENTFFIRDGCFITDGKNHSKYIGIHHYAFRDEKYFYEIRLPRETDLKPEALIEMQEQFNLVKNYKILEVIKKHHPEMYEKKWKGPHDHKVRIKQALGKVNR